MFSNEFINFDAFVDVYFFFCRQLVIHHLYIKRSSNYSFVNNFKLSDYPLKMSKFSIFNALIIQTFINIYYLRSLTSEILVNIFL